MNDNNKEFIIDRKNGLKSEVDKITGEIISVEHGTPTFTFESEIISTKKKREAFYKIAGRMKFGGDFVWLQFDYSYPLLPQISGANLTRLIYTGTFCSTINNKLDKDYIKTSLNLNKNRWSDFLSVSSDQKLIILHDSVMLLNPNIISKGKIKPTKDFTRIFSDYVRALYESCDSANEHTKLSYIFRMIPYANRQTNILAQNPTEQEKEKIIPIKFPELCDILGYSRSHASRLKTELSELEVKGEKVILFREKNIVINPHIFYGGADKETYSALCSSFSDS